MVGIRHYNIYEAPYNHKNQYIFVANHISYMDVPVMIKVMDKQNFRILGKSEMAKVPIFGFIYKKAVVMVDRKSPKDRAESIRILMSVIRKNISVFIFPEGTFNETGQPLKHFFDGAFRVAIETGTPIKPIIFLDAYDRLNYKSIFSLTPGRSRASERLNRRAHLKARRKQILRPGTAESETLSSSFSCSNLRSADGFRKFVRRIP